MASLLYTLVDKNREHLRAWLPWVDNTQSVTDIESFIERSIVNFARGALKASDIFTKKVAAVAIIAKCGSIRQPESEAL